jgi:CelD/BcsL family acetyltransferase involved in cellulose biosynthesis
LAELRGLEPVWGRLLAASDCDNPFLTWAWCATWAEHYARDGALRLIVGYGADGAPVGIAPLHLARTPGGFGVPARELAFLGLGEACPAYLDFIVAAAEREAFTAAVFETVYGSMNDWDVLTLGEVAAESLLVDHWGERMGEAGKVLDLSDPSPCPVVDLPEGIDAFRAALSRNARYNLKRKRKALDEAGKAEFRHGGASGTPEALGLAALVDLHQGRWRGRGGGAFASARFRAFHHDVAAAFAERGWLDLDLLLLGGEPAAGIYGFTYGGCYYYYLPGFDEARVPRASPGFLLLMARVERCIEQGTRRVDLLKGLADYKLQLATRVRRCVTLRCYRRGFRALLFKGVRGLKDLAKIGLR